MRLVRFTKDVIGLSCRTDEIALVEPGPLTDWKEELRYLELQGFPFEILEANTSWPEADDLTECPDKFYYYNWKYEGICHGKKHNIKMRDGRIFIAPPWGPDPFYHYTGFDIRDAVLAIEKKHGIKLKSGSDPIWFYEYYCNFLKQDILGNDDFAARIIADFPNRVHAMDYWHRIMKEHLANYCQKRDIWDRGERAFNRWMKSFRQEYPIAPDYIYPSHSLYKQWVQRASK